MLRALRTAATVAVAAALTFAPAAAWAQLPPVPTIPDDDDDTEGHETPNPGGKDHAEATGWHIRSDEFEEDDIRLAYTRAEMDEDGANRGDASAFRMGPVEPATAHSDSREGPGSDSAFSGAVNCDLGFVCFGAMYATAESTESGSTNRSTAESGILQVCLLPFEEEETIFCDGGFGFMTSESEVERDKSTGETHSRARTTPAFLCLAEADTVAAAEICGRIASHSTSDSNGGSEDGTTSRSSVWSGVLFVEFLDTELVNEDGEYSEAESFFFTFDDPPESFEEAQGCPEPPIANGGCGHTNQGESFEFPGGAASRQEALHIVGWETDESVFFSLHMGVAQSLARQSDEVLGAGVGRGTGDVLAFTGAGVAGLAALALSLLFTGGYLSLVTRRRRG